MPGVKKDGKKSYRSFCHEQPGPAADVHVAVFQYGVLRAGFSFGPYTYGNHPGGIFVLQALLSATVFFFEIPSGFLSDAIGYRQTILLSFLLNFAARVLMLLSQNFWMFATEAVVEGLAAALNSGTISGYVYSISERDTYAVNMAEINRCSEFGFLLSTLGFSVIYQCLGMRGLLLGTAAAAFAAFLASCRLSQKPAASYGASDLQRSRAAGFWTLAAVAKWTCRHVLLGSLLAGINLWRKRRRGHAAEMPYIGKI